MCLIEKTGDIVPMSVRAIGAGGLQETPLPPNCIAARKNLGKANFYKTFHVSFRLSFSLKELFFILSLSRPGKAS